MFAQQTSTDVLTELGTSTAGISSAAIEERRARYGWNELPEKRKNPLWLFLRQFQDILVYILLVALALSIAKPFFKEEPITFVSFAEAIAIFVIVFLNAVLGFVQEFKAEEAIAMLRKLAAPSVRVRRDGVEKQVPSREVVPGDVIIVESGARIVGDGRLLTAAHLEVDESSLTGESLPVSKQTDPLKSVVGLGDMRNMVFGGTSVTRGYGEYVVTAIGQETELGKIARMVGETDLPETPLQQRLHRLSSGIGAVVLVLSSIMVFVQISRQYTLTDSLLMAVSLAVSAVPEGLPAVVTACLALGVRRMVKQNVLVRRLEALEALGSVTVICTDKTGTVTENRMEVVDAWLAPGADPETLRTVVASCNRATLPDLGDPTELGLLRWATPEKRLSIDDEEVPFTSEEKYMQTRHGQRVFLKGAPERLAAFVTHDTSDMLAAADAMAAKGLRVIASAERVHQAIHIVGLVGMEDPPRSGVTEAVQAAKSAGIRTIMITGDNVKTAAAIAARVGIVGEAMEGKDLSAISDDDLRQRLPHVSVFARVAPEHKLRILQVLKSMGEVVAMSGDGVNDAPALKGAHVGVAMGKNGTDVAREAGSIVLTDDHFASIVGAVREGRHIYDNIRKFILCLLQTNFYEMLFFFSAILMGWPVPYLPMHILWINLMTDGLPALALSMEKPDADIMERPPRSPRESIFAGYWVKLLFASAIPFITVVSLYRWALNANLPLPEVRSIVFTFAILFELFFVSTMRSRQTVWKIGVFSNPWLIGSIVLPVMLHMVLLYTPVSTAFQLAPLSLERWLMIIPLAAGGLVFFELWKVVARWFPRARASA